ncbi:MAG: chromosome segregation protein SMC, partial [Halieaceae bacterium]|nr:chromosome segregation protein SMC [Halieaceae bacterium]
IEQHRVDHTERTDAFNQVQASYYSLGSEVARLEQTLKHQQERGRQLREDLRQTEASLAESESHLGEDRNRLGGWEAELATLAPELELLQAVEETSAEALLQAEDAMHNWQHRWDEFNQHAAEPRQQAEVQQSRIRHVEQVLQRIQGRIRQLEEEQRSLVPGPAEEEVVLLGEQLAELERVMAEHEARSDALVDQLSATRDRSSTLSADLNQARSTLQQKRGRQASLEALQQAAMDDGDASVGAWLQARQLAGKPRLLEQIQVDDGWQLAVETVLGDYLQAVCVDEIGSLGSSLEQLEQGRVALLEAGPNPQAPAEYLGSRVRCG